MNTTNHEHERNQANMPNSGDAKGTKPSNTQLRWRDQIFQNEALNFLMTNRLGRNAMTLFMGWFSKITQPQIRDASIWAWRQFAHVDLHDAKKQNFASLHDCFTRELVAGARVVDNDDTVMTSPCDAIVGTGGSIAGVVVFQAKDSAYTLNELFNSDALAEMYRDGCYVTLRLTSSMYHRFHSPLDGVVTDVSYISGDTWNVNAPALKRVARLFCKNERAVISLDCAHLSMPYRITLVPVAAVLVASIRLHFLNILFHLRYRGAEKISCNVAVVKGEELGYFEHGSTIIVFAPKGFSICEKIVSGTEIKMGQALMILPIAAAST